MFKTIIVVDDDFPDLGENQPAVITFEEYLHEYPKLNEPRIRIVNLCDTRHYLSKGYYCSLLAEARQHKVIPSVKIINELRNSLYLAERNWIKGIEQPGVSDAYEPMSFIICLGKASKPEMQKLATRLFKRYSVPILRVSRIQDSGQLVLDRVAYNDLNGDEKAVLEKMLIHELPAAWSSSVDSKKYRWEMAILVNPNEVVPPSNKAAITRFVKAAKKLGINAKTTSIDELFDVNHYDALFIRETTSIDHYTYRLACESEQNGLVVLDDSTSILRCCNKVFLHDAFNYQHVPSLQTEVVDNCSETTCDKIESEFDYPMVLKMPEGSFSQGVYKVETREALKDKLSLLLQDSSLALVQEYLYTDYDWRIGVMNGRAIYACRYYMARNHWQIYNHGSKRYFSGGFDCLPTFETPRIVLDAALNAARVVGNGLYGVDIKLCNDRAYVIEVNDNPSIDHGVEDAYLGEELYMQIMSEFLRRLELRGR